MTYKIYQLVIKRFLKCTKMYLAFKRLPWVILFSMAHLIYPTSETRQVNMTHLKQDR